MPKIKVKPCTDIPVAVPGSDPRLVLPKGKWTDVEDEPWVARRVREGLLELQEPKAAGGKGQESKE